MSAMVDETMAIGKSVHDYVMCGWSSRGEVSRESTSGTIAFSDVERELKKEAVEKFSRMV